MRILNLDIGHVLIRIMVLAGEERLDLSQPPVGVYCGPSIVNSRKQKVPGVERGDVLIRNWLLCAGCVLKRFILFV